ncbi:hypothetical protein [Luteimonas pelagia]
MAGLSNVWLKVGIVLLLVAVAAFFVSAFGSPHVVPTEAVERVAGYVAIVGGVVYFIGRMIQVRAARLRGSRDDAEG